ncbi:hypothetical protein GCM10028803_44250 [Larkinella knui]|uniref:Uncharacterized protein n=1 Tax=Larkinella knui TaxID=2025310 RepID=A0A3P1CP61_9BACT|nr:hypothetical protein [Larkinella knui]RRB15039.1 hypothetical protein EHT87_10810 [Larkinella knui]
MYKVAQACYGKQLSRDTFEQTERFESAILARPGLAYFLMGYDSEKSGIIFFIVLTHPKAYG